MRMSRLPEAEHWYVESLRSKSDHIPAHLTYGKLLALTVSLSASPGKWSQVLSVGQVKGWEGFGLKIAYCPICHTVSVIPFNEGI